MSHCLVRILGWRNDWAVIFRKRGRKCSNSEWPTLLQQGKGIFLASIRRYVYGGHVVPAGWRNLSHCAKLLSCCEKIFVAVSSHAMAIRIGHRGGAIWHHATSFFGGLWNLVSMPTNHKQFLGSRWRFDVWLAKLSRNYAEMSSRVSSKEQECASRVMGDICQILCSTINRSVYFILK